MRADGRACASIGGWSARRWKGLMHSSRAGPSRLDSSGCRRSVATSSPSCRGRRSPQDWESARPVAASASPCSGSSRSGLCSRGATRPLLLAGLLGFLALSWSVLTVHRRREDHNLPPGFYQGLRPERRRKDCRDACRRYPAAAGAGTRPGRACAAHSWSGASPGASVCLTAWRCSGSPRWWSCCPLR